MIDKLKFEESNPQRPLFHRVVKGGVWVFSLRIATYFFHLIRLIILARILAPHDFGLLGIALVTMATLETFSQTGFNEALVQKKESIKGYLDAAWTITVLRGIVLFFGLYFIAPYIAVFFNSSQALAIVRIIALSFLIQAFTNIGVIYFQKELQFNKQFIYRASGTLADFIVAVSAAIIFRSVWALVFGFLAGNIARLVVSYLVHPYMPRISFDLKKIKELFVFGRWIWASGILIFLLTQGDDIFVGKLLGVTMLGFYQMAYRISNVPATEITHVLSHVTFPTYSILQDNIPRLREAYLKVLQITAFLSFPLAGLIFILAHDFTNVLLGEKWIPMVPAIMALCIFGVTRMINATTGPVFQGIGKPKISTFGSVFQMIVFIAIIYPLTSRWGILGTSISVVIPNILFMIYISTRLANVMNCKLSYLISPLLSPLIGSITMCLIIFFIKSMILNVKSLIDFLMLTLLGIGTYIIFVYMIDKFSSQDLKKNLKQLFNEVGLR